jgi:NAD(P)-dependent dehydrogenase (short-subunit alcohol dehydrogenase family)
MGDDRLAGRSIIVTGAGTASGVGNGQAIARTLARHGAAVLCVDKVAERAEACAAAIEAEGGRAHEFAGDVTDVATTERMAAAAVAAHGGIDGLVNCVGIVSRLGLQPRTPDALSELELFDADDWNLVMAVNVTAAMLCTRAVAPAMRARGGAIVNIGSTRALRWYRGASLAYSTAKAALEGLTLATAGALGPFGIRVNLLVIGQVLAPHIEARARALGNEGEALLEERRLAGLVTARNGTPWDVAAAVMFLLGPDSEWISAQTLVVDAGASKAMR